MQVYKCISHALHCLAGFLFLYSFQHPLSSSDVFRFLDSLYYMRIFWKGRLICVFQDMWYLHYRRSHVWKKYFLKCKSEDIFSAKKENIFLVKQKKYEIIILFWLLQKTCVSFLSLYLNIKNLFLQIFIFFTLFLYQNFKIWFDVTISSNENEIYYFIEISCKYYREKNIEC